MSQPGPGEDLYLCQACETLTPNLKDHRRLDCVVTREEEEMFRAWVTMAKWLSKAKGLDDDRRFIAQTVHQHVKDQILRKQKR